MLRRKKIETPAPEIPPKEESPLDKDLQVIYGMDNGETPDLTKLDVRKKNGLTRTLLWLLVTLLILAGAAFAGYLLFQRAVSGDNETLAFSIQGPDEVTSGDEVQFDVVYENKGQVPLASLEIKLNLPEGFSVSTMEPLPTTEPNIWTVGSVTPGSDGLIRLKGIWLDPVPSGQTLQAIATYRPANFNADFQDIATKTIAVRTSALTLKVEGAASAVPGASVDYTFTMKNEGGIDLSDIRLRLEIPTSYIVSATDPAPLEAGAHEWKIDALAPDAEATVRVSGSFAADATGLQTIHGSLGILRDQDYLEQTTTDAQTDVIGGGLSLRLIANGSTNDQTADLGTTMRLSIDVTNGGDQPVSGLTTTLLVSSPSKTSPIDWEHADLAGGSISVNTITWKGSALSKGGALLGNDRETIDLSLPLLDEIGTASDTFTLAVNATVSDIGGVTASRSVQSTPLTVTLNSDTELTALARYFEDETPVGSGPLPPQVGQTTRYRLYWSIDNSLHALDDLTLTATLPPSVTFVGAIETDIGTVSFDTATRVLTWTIDRLPTSVTHVSTSFDLSITPTAEDVGKFVKLLNETLLVATDSKTTSRLQRTSDEITTELPDDPQAAGKGAVIE